MPPQQAEQDFRIYLSRRTFDPNDKVVTPPAEKLAAWYVVQFVKPLGPEERERLRNQHGLSLQEYIPNFAYMEFLSAERWNEVSNDPLYRASELYRPEDKISPHIGDPRPLRALDGSSVEGLLLRAVLFKGADPQRVVEAINKIKEEYERADAGRAVALRRTRVSKKARDESEMYGPEAIEAPKVLDDREIGGQLQVVFVLPSAELLLPVARLEGVRWIEEVVRAVSTACSSPNLVAGTIQAGDPSLTPFWARGINGAGQRIGIIDEQLPDLKHCMFKDARASVAGQTHRKFLGLRGIGNLPNAHGTHVASIIAGDNIDQPGTDSSRGVAWAATLSFDDLHFITGHRRTLMSILTEQASEDIVTIHCNSWADLTAQYNETARVVDTFVRLNENNLVCGSTANANQNLPLGPPGMAKNALCVSASLQHPKHLTHGDGVPGPTQDCRFKPEICAPGIGINVATATSGCQCAPVQNCETSWATPVVAGAAALARQYYLEGWYRTGTKNGAESHTPTAALLKATLLNSTVRMNGVSPTGRRGGAASNSYPSRHTGWGLLKLDNTLFFEGGPRRLFFKDVRNADGLQTDGSQTHRFNVQSSGQPLKITLVWSDPPADNAVSCALVNDLDLIVTAPLSGGSQTFLGNNFVDGVSVEGGEPDTFNNVEMVVVPTPAVGEWVVEIKAKRVAVDTPQGYALVASADLTP